MKPTAALPTVLLITMALLSPSNAAAVAGKWTPEQILELDPAWLRELGLELPARELWDPERGGLFEAAVQIDGCSSGFISSQGLLVTNHHCAFGLLQEHSSPERDLIAEGFLAVTVADELPGSTTRATVPHRFTDVTAEIEAAVPAGADDLARFEAIDRKKKELVAACEQQPFRRCKVASYDDGVRYVLIEALEFRDVRMVWAPPRAVGEYGGEVDNWSWPRHTGDFALLRVYAGSDNQPADRAAGNRPYRPRRHFAIAREGVRKGDFVMLAGYPSRTYRSFVAAEMAERAELYFPRRAVLYADWMAIMNAASGADPAVSILLADRLKTLANREKASHGQVQGIARGKLLEQKRASEEEALAWAAAQPEHQGAVAAYRELSERMEQLRASTWEREFLLEEIQRGPLDLSMAVRLARWAIEREKLDLERQEDYQERNREKLRRDQQRDQKRLHPPTERRLLEDLLGRLAALPEDQRVAAVEALLAGDRSPQAIARAAASLQAGTRVHDVEARLAMFEESREQLEKRNDPLLSFALALQTDLLAKERREHERDGAASRLRPVWRRAVQAFLAKPLDADANGTLRVTLAHVEGYRPRDGMWMEPRTRLAGVVEKHTGKEPFAVPKAVLEAAPRAAQSRWADEGLGDVPVCFLSTADTTGGNSGSPVINGRGELVGVNFDRVWENVANDFGYDPAVARNVSADVRYLLWLLEELGGERSGRILEELGVGR